MTTTTMMRLLVVLAIVFVSNATGGETERGVRAGAAAEAGAAVKEGAAEHSIKPQQQQQYLRRAAQQQQQKRQWQVRGPQKKEQQQSELQRQEQQQQKQQQQQHHSSSFERNEQEQLRQQRQRQQRKLTIEHRKLRLIDDTSALIVNEYIVELDPTKVKDVTLFTQQWLASVSASSASASSDRSTTANIGRIYESSLYGFSLKLRADDEDGTNNHSNNNNEDYATYTKASALLMDLLEHDSVVTVEEDQIAEVLAATTDVTSSLGQWGLDYLSWPIDNRYTWDLDGTGIHAYVVDTGLEINHVEFNGRAVCAHEVVSDVYGRPCFDGHSHGTHVAGVIGGRTVGMAKNVNLHSVKVLDASGSGSMSDVAAGVDWVVTQKRQGIQRRPMILNLSVGGGVSQALNTAVNAAVSAGILVVGAASNGGGDSCQSSPGSATRAFIVGAITFQQRPAGFSNTGSCVDIWAPGVDIMSAGPGSLREYITKSGTSQAAPFVSGLAAMYMQKGLGPSATQAAILRDARTVSSLSSSLRDGSPSLVAFSGVVSGVVASAAQAQAAGVATSASSSSTSVSSNPYRASSSSSINAASTVSTTITGGFAYRNNNNYGGTTTSSSKTDTYNTATSSRAQSVKVVEEVTTTAAEDEGQQQQQKRQQPPQEALDLKHPYIREYYGFENHRERLQKPVPAQ